MSLKVILYDKDDDNRVQKCHGLKTEKVYESKWEAQYSEIWWSDSREGTCKEQKPHCF